MIKSFRKKLTYISCILLLFISLSSPQVALAASTDATLSSITINGLPMSGFDSDTYTYEFVSEYTVGQMEIEATATDPNAQITGDTGTQVLSVGLNTFTITCTAEDGVTTQDYVLKFTRGKDPTLSDLTIDGNTVESFDSHGDYYILTVDYSTDQIVIGATATDPNAQITGDTGTQSLEVGSNAFFIFCTAEDGLYFIEYTLVITREAESAGSDATLSDLSINSSTVTGFASDVYTYNITVDYLTNQINIGATATDTNAQITGDTGLQSLMVGLNAFTVTCTAEDGTTTQDYVLNITRRTASTDATLSDLVIDGNTVTGFASDTYTYDIDVGNATDEIEVGATATDINAQITGDSGTQSLVVGLNTLTVTCTAEDGTTTQDYVLNITRGSEPVPEGLVFDKATGTITDYTGNATTLNIPSRIDGVDVVAIGYRAFIGCDTLISVTIPFGVVSLDTCAFQRCENLSSVTLPNSLETIGDNAFYVCKSLDNIIIPDNVTSIGETAFYSCDQLSSINIPAKVTSIGEKAIASCNSLSSITVDAGNPSYMAVDGVLFTKDGLTLIQYNIGNSRTDYTVPTGVTSIKRAAFYQCEDIVNITVSNSVESIEMFAFSECPNLSGVTLSNSLSIISEHLFQDCSSLSSIAIPDGVTSIEEFAFLRCHNLVSITVGVNNQSYKSVDGVLFTKDSHTLIQYPIGNPMQNYTVPYGTASINDYAFYDGIKLRNVTIPSGVTSIGDYTFYYEIEEDDFVEAKPLMNLTIYGQTGSCAETYAYDNNIAFEVIIGTDATLSDLAIDGTTVQGFTSSTYTYDITVGNVTDEIEVDASATDVNAQITGDTGPQSLSVGSNTLTVTCTAVDGTTTQDYVLNITREAGPTKVAILFGMADYVGTENDLNGPVNDMIAMQAVLEHAGYTVHKYMNYGATDLLTTVEAVASNMPEGNTLLFAYSGHGVDGGYLVGVDNYGISIADLENKLSLHTGVKEVLIDACYSGDFIGKGMESRSYTKIESEKEFNDYIISVFESKDTTMKARSLAESGYYVMTACSGSQLSYEFAFSIPNSPFAASNLMAHQINDDTYYYLGYFNVAFHDGFGLYNDTQFSTLWADSNSDNILTWNELYEYAANNINDQQQAQVYPINSAHVVYGSSVGGGSELQSSTYTIDQDTSIVSNVPDLTSIADFKANFDNDAAIIRVYDTSDSEVTTGNVGTGMTVKLVINGTVEDELEVCVLGDVNSDGVIDISDYTYVRLKIFELRDLTGVYFMAGDVNKDGSIDISDYTYVRLDIFDLRPIN